jgi:hypothetical protein
MRTYGVAGLTVAAWLATAAVSGAESRTMAGTISDSLCGMSHKEMAAKQASKITDRDCVIACLNYSTDNSPKLVFVEKGGKVYQISNQKFPGLIRHAGETLSVTGDLDGTALTIAKIEAAK